MFVVEANFLACFILVINNHEKIICFSRTSTRSPKEGSQKFKLNLPLPKFNQTDETKEDLVETIHESKDDTKTQPTDFVKDDTKVEETDHVESKNINKKIGRVFVRRNASIYSSTSDPNDD